MKTNGRIIRTIYILKLMIKVLKRNNKIKGKIHNSVETSFLFIFCLYL